MRSLVTSLAVSLLSLCACSSSSSSANGADDSALTPAGGSGGAGGAGGAAGATSPGGAAGTGLTTSTSAGGSTSPQGGSADAAGGSTSPQGGSADAAGGGQATGGASQLTQCSSMTSGIGICVYQVTSSGNVVPANDLTANGFVLQRGVGLGELAAVGNCPAGAAAGQYADDADRTWVSVDIDQAQWVFAFHIPGASMDLRPGDAVSVDFHIRNPTSGNAPFAESVELRDGNGLVMWAGAYLQDTLPAELTVTPLATSCQSDNETLQSVEFKLGGAVVDVPPSSAGDLGAYRVAQGRGIGTLSMPAEDQTLGMPLLAVIRKDLVPVCSGTSSVDFGVCLGVADPTATPPPGLYLTFDGPIADAGTGAPPVACGGPVSSVPTTSQQVWFQFVTSDGMTQTLSLEAPGLTLPFAKGQSVKVDYSDNQEFPGISPFIQQLTVTSETGDLLFSLSDESSPPPGVTFAWGTPTCQLSESCVDAETYSNLEVTIGSDKGTIAPGASGKVGGYLVVQRGLSSIEYSQECADGMTPMRAVLVAKE